MQGTINLTDPLLQDCSIIGASDLPFPSLSSLTHDVEWRLTVSLRQEIRKGP